MALKSDVVDEKLLAKKLKKKYCSTTSQKERECFMCVGVYSYFILRHCTSKLTICVIIIQVWKQSKLSYKVVMAVIKSKKTRVVASDGIKLLQGDLPINHHCLTS